MKKVLPLLLITLFGLSRLFIWVYKPPEFSEIIYSYMPYAHLWDSGVTPYLEQWYEYPPATIPLFYAPHWIDKNTHGTLLQTNYSQAYRGILLIIDVCIFALVWLTLKKLRVKTAVFAGACVYYIVVTAKAHDFLYDTMDWSFAGTMILGVVAPILLSEKVGTFTSWLGFWLAVGLKYINAPLAVVYGLLDFPVKKLSVTGIKQLITAQKTWLKLVIIGTAFLIVWAFPLLYFRSSLQVSLLYQQLRGLQVDTAAAVIVRTIDRLTHTEQIIEVYKNYETAGPLSNQALQILNVLFPVSLVIYLAGCGYLILSSKFTQAESNRARIWLTLGYVLVFMLTGKVLSRPFLLWHIPLIAAFPFKNLKAQLFFTLTSGLIIFTSLSPVSNAEIGFITLPILVGWIRTISFAVMLGGWLVLSRSMLKTEKAN